MVHKLDSYSFRIQQSQTSIQYATQKHSHHSPITTEVNSQFATSDSTEQMNFGWILLIQIHQDTYLKCFQWILPFIYIWMDISEWIINVERIIPNESTLSAR